MKKSDTIKKSDVIEKLYRRQWTKLGRKGVKNAVHMLIGEITNHLTKGGRLEIRKFGTVYLKGQRKKMGRNPRTGEKILVEPKYAIRFRMSRPLLERINPKLNRKSKKT